ncbi:MAG TPA: hypothetical protein VE996_06900 [Terriglobales bacterium]|nr:hypothetical protein [Terriglobales bacterium]
MAFVRKKGKSFYLVHNVREDGRVRQVHLACLGNRPRISDEVIEQVRNEHPGLEIDWGAVRKRASETFASPFADVEGVRQLSRSIRALTLDLKELDLRELGRQPEQTRSELMSELHGLRDALEEKFNQGTAPESAQAGREEEARKSGT